MLLTIALVAAVLYRGGQQAGEKQTGLKIIDDNVDLYIRDVHFAEVGDSGNRVEINADSADRSSIAGALGADGAGFADGSVLRLTQAGRSWLAFVKRV